MKSALRLTGVLSWINLAIACFFVFFGFMGSMIMGNIGMGLIAVVFFGAIGLHSYAALQLRKSILYGYELDRKTPGGIQIMGFISMFIAFVSITNGFTLLRHTDEVIKELEKNFSSQLYQNIDLSVLYMGVGYFVIVFGLLVLINVLINLSLLRWYRNRQNN